MMSSFTSKRRKRILFVGTQIKVEDHQEVASHYLKYPKNQLQITLFASDRLPQFDKKKKTKLAFLRNGMRDGPVKAGYKMDLF
jgi:hypothetical protein